MATQGGGCRGVPGFRGTTSMPLSENIEGSTAHFTFNSFHCCSRTPLYLFSFSLCLSLSLSVALYAEGHVNTCRKPFANPRQLLHTPNSSEPQSPPPCPIPFVVLAGWSCKQIAQFFLLFSGFFHFSSFCLLLLTRWRLSTYYLVKGVRLQLEIVMAKRETAAATTTTKAASEKWKKWKNPMRKNAKKYLLVGYPAPRYPAPMFPPYHPACLLRKQ